MIVQRQLAWETLPKPDQKGIAVLGCGYWGVNYLRVLNELPTTQVAAVCDMRQSRLQEVGRIVPDALLTTSVDEALAAPNVDAVVICTEATSHYEIARRCLNAGKHLLIEKPMTTSVAHAEELVELAQRLGLVLMVGHVFLFNAGVQKMKEYVAEGKIGELYYLYARRTNLGPIRRDVNAIWDLAAHDIAIFDYLLGASPSWVSAVGSKVLRNGHEDVGFVSIGYPNDVIAHIHVSWTDPNKVREVVVVGSDMRIVFDDLNSSEQVRVYEKGVTACSSQMSSFGEYHFQMRDGDIISPHIKITEPLKNQVSHFVECMVQGGHPISSGQDGLEVVQVMNAIDLSIAQHGAPVMIPQGIVSPVVRAEGAYHGH